MTIHIPLSLRVALDLLEQRGELLRVSAPVSPVHEFAAILKALEEGPALFFENLADFPGMRGLGNVFARRDNMAALFGLDDHRALKRRFLEAIRNPLPPVSVNEAPCQQTVITGEIDIHQILPLVTHTPEDAGPVLGGGVVVWADASMSHSELSFKRMFFRGKDWGTLNAIPGTHLHTIIRQELEKGADRVPLTVNIGAPPAAMLTAAAYGPHVILRDGGDEVAIAGAAQGAPLALAKGKTVDAWALAESEIVLEGYVLAEHAFETDEAAAIGKPRVSTFFPEWLGYQGKALKPPKFVITAVTHRAENPIFHNPLASGWEAENMSRVLREGCLLQICEQNAPGLVVDLTVPFGMRANAGLALQVRKRGPDDDALTRKLIGKILKISLCRLVVAVDGDVDIYSADDVLWAITGRMHHTAGMQRTRDGYPSLGYILQEYAETSGYGGGEGMGFDATAPYSAQPTFRRAHYPVEGIDLGRWFSHDQVARIRANQSDYARLMARLGG